MKNRLLIIILSIFITTAGFSLSYQFDPGEYYLLDGRVNVRSEPNLSGKVIGQLNINDKINIIECTFNEQTINEVSAYWYKIKYNNSNGYIWGGYIAVKTFIYDVDNNGINDFFHFRVSRIEKGHNIINGNSDIFCYFNGKLIPYKFGYDLPEPNEYGESYIYIFNDCFFSYDNDKRSLFINVRNFHFIFYYAFLFTLDGKIVHDVPWI